MGSSSSFSSSYPSRSRTAPSSFNQQQNLPRDSGSGAQYQGPGESSSNQMATTSKNPPQYHPDPQPQLQPQPQPPAITTDRPPRYSGGNTEPQTVYVDSRYDYGMRMCMRGQHDYRTEYGLAGILCAIFCFPCGLLGLCIDVERICRRCGARKL